MSNRKSTLTPAQINALSLEDLLSGVDPSKLAKASQNPKQRPTPTSLMNREAEREHAIAEAARRHRETQRKLSPWLPECVVLCLVCTTCTHCGSSYTAPAAETLLIRFRNRRDGSTWEVANHPSQLNPSLPREERTLDTEVHACPQCFRGDSVLTHYTQTVLAESAESAELTNPGPNEETSQ